MAARYTRSVTNPSAALTFSLPSIDWKSLSLSAPDWRAVSQRLASVRLPRISVVRATGVLIAALAYPATILGGVMVFVLSSQFALGLFASSVHQFTSPLGFNIDFNVPAPVQLAELHPKPTPRSMANAAGRVESSFTTVAAPSGSTAFTVAAPTESSFASVAGPDTGRIGPSAVNLRSGPSNDSPVLGVLAAGTLVTTSASDKGWIMVSANGATGWVYQSFLEGSLSITVSGGVATIDP